MGAIKHFKLRTKHSAEFRNAEINRIQRPFFRPWENKDFKEEETENYSISEEHCVTSEQAFSEPESEHGENTKCCPYCPATFTRKDNLTRHKKNKHDHFQNPKCPFCKKKLSRQDAVQRHMTTCSRNPTAFTQILESTEFVRIKWEEREH